MTNEAMTIIQTMCTEWCMQGEQVNNLAGPPQIQGP